MAECGNNDPGEAPACRGGKPKHVVMFNCMSFLPHQGQYLRIYNEAKSLTDAGYHVTVLAWDRDASRPPVEDVDGIRVERIPLKAGFNQGPSNVFKQIVFTFELIRRTIFRKVDVLHCFNLNTMLAGLFVGKLRRRKIILDLCEPSYYTHWPRRYRLITAVIGWMERCLSRMFDCVLVHNFYQIRKFESSGIRRIEHISSAPPREMIVDEMPQRDPGGCVTFGRFGSIYPDVGMEETVAFISFLARRGDPVRLLIAGRVWDEYQERFDRLIEPVREYVDLSGPYDISRISELYSRIDISLQLYRMTNLNMNITPTKFFESLAHGVPVISSNMGDVRELIDRHGCGVVVDETDPAAMARRTEDLMASAELRRGMAARGLDLVSLEYNWDVMEQRLLRRYESVLAGRSRVKESR